MINQIRTIGSQTASNPIRVNGEQPNFKLGLFVRLSGGASMTYNVEYCYQEPESAEFAASPDWRVVTGLSALTASGQALFELPVQMVRLNVTTYGSGTGQLTVVQTY